MKKLLFLIVLVPTMVLGQVLDSRIPVGKGQTQFIGQVEDNVPITTDSAEELYAAADGVQLFVTELTISNMDTTTATAVIISETSDGDAKWTCPAAINGGGCAVSFSPPLPFTASTGIFCKPLTTGATVYCAIKGIKVTL